MSKTFKHQDLISNQKLSIACPDIGYREIRIMSYRWTLFPIDNAHNFLPNFLYDKLRNAPQRRNSKDDDKITCSLCALSMFNSEVSAKKRFLGLTERVRENLGYTHIAEGEIEENDGVSSEISREGHFTFFEYEKCDLSSKFVIKCELI